MIFCFIFALAYELRVLVRTATLINEAVLTTSSTHNLCAIAKLRKIMHTPVF